MVGKHDVIIVHEDDVPHLWPLALPWLQMLHDKYMGPTPDSLYDSVMTGSALFVLYGHEGFAIVEPFPDTYFVTSMAAFSGVSSVPVDVIISNATAHAKAMGFKFVQVKSPRKAWTKLLAPLGFEWDGEYTFTKRL